MPPKSKSKLVDGDNLPQPETRVRFLEIAAAFNAEQQDKMELRAIELWETKDRDAGQEDELQRIMAAQQAANQPTEPKREDPKDALVAYSRQVKFVDQILAHFPMGWGTPEADNLARAKGELPGWTTILGHIDATLKKGAANAIPEPLILDGLRRSVRKEDPLFGWATSQHASRIETSAEFKRSILDFMATTTDTLQDRARILWSSAALYAPDGKTQLQPANVFATYSRAIWNNVKDAGALSLSEADAVDATKVRMGATWMKRLYERERLKKLIHDSHGNRHDDEWKIDTFSKLLNFVNDATTSAEFQHGLFIADGNIEEKTPTPVSAVTTLAPAVKRANRPPPGKLPLTCPDEPPTTLANGRTAKFPTWFYQWAMGTVCKCGAPGHEEMAITMCEQKSLLEWCNKVNPQYSSSLSARLKKARAIKALRTQQVRTCTTNLQKAQEWRSTNIPASGDDIQGEDAKFQRIIQHERELTAAKEKLTRATNVVSQMEKETADGRAFVSQTEKKNSPHPPDIISKLGEKLGAIVGHIGLHCWEERHAQRTAMTLQTATTHFILQAGTGPAHEGTILDTGAFAHVTPRPQELRYIQDLPNPITITGIGQRSITQKGFHPIWGEMYILTSLPLTILSFGQFILSTDHKVQFVDGTSPSQTRFEIKHRNGTSTFQFHPTSCLFWHHAPESPTPPRTQKANVGMYDSLRESEDTAINTESTSTALPDVARRILTAIPDEPLELPDDTPTITLDPDTTPPCKNHCFTVKPDTPTSTAKVHRVHKALGHPGREVMMSLARAGMLHGISPAQVETWATSICTGCIQGKSKAPAAVKNLSKKYHHSAKVGEVLHMDIFFVHAALNVKQAMVMFTDENCGWTRVRQMRSQTTAELARLAFETIYFLKAFGHHTTTVVSDREENLKKLQHALLEIGVVMQYTPEGRKDGRAEAKIGIIKSRARATYHGLSYPLPHRFTPALLVDTADIYNLLPNKSVGLHQHTAPYDLVYRRTDRAYIIHALHSVSFGEAGLFHLPISQYGKKSEGHHHNSMASHADFGFVVGRDLNTPHTAQVFFPIRGVTLDSSQGTPLEPGHVDPSALLEWTKMFNKDAPPGMPMKMLNNVPYQPPLNTSDKWSKLLTTRTNKAAKKVTQKKKTSTLSNTTVQAPKKGGPARPIFYSKGTSAAQLLKDRLATTKRNQESIHTRVMKHIMAGHRVSLKEARKHQPDALMEAAYEEAEKLISHKAITPVHNVPKDGIRGRGMQVVELKKGKLAMRCVFDTIHKRAGSDTDHYSPTARAASTILLTSIAQHLNLDMRVMDIKRAFLHSPLPKDNKYYIEFHREMAQALIQRDPSMAPFYNKTNDTLICHLDKALYGLEEASRAWYNELRKTMTIAGYKVHPYDAAIFYKGQGESLSIAGTHVDDILAIGSTKSISKLGEKLDTLYGIKSQQGPHMEYLGMIINTTTTQGKRTVHLHQKPYESQLLTDLPPSFQKLKKQETPTITGPEFWNEDPSATRLPKSEQTDFISILHKLMFLATRTRPEIAVATSFLSTRKDGPNETDKKKLLHILGYLEAHQDYPGILIQPKNLQLSCFVDASYGCHSYTNRRRSQIGYTIAIGQSWVMSKSARTKITCDSATAAEVYGLHEALREVLWTRYFVQELGFNQAPIPIFEDNDGTVKLVKLTSGWAGKSKHMEIRYFKAKDMIDDNIIKVIHVNTNQQLADHLTKPLTHAVFKDQIDKVQQARIALKSQS